MKRIIPILGLTFCLAFGLDSRESKADVVKIKITAKSANELDPIYIQTMEFGENRKFIRGDEGVFNLHLERDKVYSVYVGQKGMQTVLFNVNTYIEEMLTGNFNFSINVSLDYKMTQRSKKIHDVEIISNEQNKPALLFQRKN
ncbi:MAG: hypothetical protein AAF487_00215 [Bacteroidota bacterium]